MAAHARFGGSSAERWLRCYGSTRLIESLPPHHRFDGNEYTEEGTVAHTVAERCLKKRHDTPEPFLGTWGPPDGVGGFSDISVPGWYEVTEEMHDCVQIYLDVVRGWVERLDGELHVEFTSRVAADVGGTADAVVTSLLGETLVVVDYKHGAGHAVDVEQNEQMMLYAAGVMRKMDLSPEEIVLVVVQPRAHHPDGKVRTWETTADVIRDFAAGALKAVDRADKPGAPLVPGEKQCRWCDAAGICPALQRFALDAARDTFADLIDGAEDDKKELPGDHLAAAMDAAPLVETWLKAVRKVSLKALETDRKAVPGWKLVAGRKGNRKWKDEKLVMEYLSKKRSVKKEEYLTTPKLRSPAQIEKINDEIAEWVKEQTERPPGKHTVARADDPREEVGEPFDDLIEDW